jgi:hypothetical protein
MVGRKRRERDLQSQGIKEKGRKRKMKSEKDQGDKGARWVTGEFRRGKRMGRRQNKAGEMLERVRK